MPLFNSLHSLGSPSKTFSDINSGYSTTFLKLFQTYILSIILILFKSSFRSKSNDEYISAGSLHEAVDTQSTINTGNIDAFITSVINVVLVRLMFGKMLIIVLLEDALSVSQKILAKT